MPRQIIDWAGLEALKKYVNWDNPLERKAYLLTYWEEVEQSNSAFDERSRQSIAQKSRTRRERKKSVPLHDFTLRQWAYLKLLYNHRCAYCGQFSAYLEQDHVIPVSKGGNYTLSNIVPACKSCNSRKHNGPPLPHHYPTRNPTCISKHKYRLSSTNLPSIFLRYSPLHSYQLLSIKPTNKTTRFTPQSVYGFRNPP